MFSQRTQLFASLSLALAACGSGLDDTQGLGTSTQDLSGTGCSANTLQGVDVSDDQGAIDWGRVAASGRRFAYAKATQGDYYRASTFASNWKGIKAAGLVRGAYHFLDGTVNGTAQADYFLDAIGGGARDPFEAGDLPPMLDWECNDAACYGGGNSPPVSASAYAQVAQDFIAEVKARTGKTTVIYTYQSFWDGLRAPGDWSAYPLDFAWPNGGCPPVPSPWKGWTFWQWDVLGAGQVPGIAGAIDVDVFNGTEAELAQLAGATPPPPVSCGGKPKLPPRPAGCGTLKPGEGLAQGNSLRSCDGRFELVMQTDGNAVLYSNGLALWSSHTNGKGGDVLDMQGDGNLVVYSDKSCALWNSGTAHHAGAELSVQDDGNAVIYDQGRAIFDTHSGGLPAKPTACGAIEPGHGLAPGESISSCDGHHALVMQTDGNLVLYHAGKGATWSSKTNGTPSRYAVVQGDGNLVVYEFGGKATFDTHTNGHDGASLAVQDDGNLVIYESGKAIWNAGIRQPTIFSQSLIFCASDCLCIDTLGA